MNQIQVTELQANGETIWPLSFPQERIWFLYRLQASRALNHLVTAFRCRGWMDYEALEWALNQVMARHDILRTAFIERKGVPGQIVKKGLQIELHATELNGRDITRICRDEAVKSFDLCRAPAIRALLVRIADDEHVIQLTLHHIIGDGWSLGILWEEIAKFYRAFVTGEATTVQPLAQQYADFAAQQRNATDQSEMQGHLEYWKNQYSSGIPVLELPLDRPRGSLPSYRGRRLPVDISPETTSRFQALASQTGATLFMVLLGSFKVLLSRYGGQRDVVVGVPAASRPSAELEHLIGCFVNTLALRTSLSGSVNTRELVRRLRDVCLGAYAHQDLPFERLVNELNPRRDLSRNPLFQVMFTLQTAPIPHVSLPAMNLQIMPSDPQVSELDLSVSVWINEEQGISGLLEYTTALFDEETMKRLIKHWQALVDDMAMTPDKELWELNFLDVAEREQLLNEWNRTEQSLPETCYLPHRFANEARRRPSARAVVCGNEELTYHALNQRVNQLARNLTKLGVGAEVRVAVCMERSLDMVVALLAILKAGGAYVPLDPQYPAERLNFMLRDSHAAVVLTQDGLRPFLPPGDALIVALDRDRSSIREHSSEELYLKIEPETAAYVIYTSGSTGQPKGVVVTHLGVANFLTAMDHILIEDSPAQWIAVTSICFDISVLELMWTLTRGYEVVVSSGRLEAHWALANLLPSEGRDWNQTKDMQCTPSFIMGMPSPQRRMFRKILVGGEPLPISVAQKSLKMASAVYNMYGPTETTVWSSVSRVTDKNRKPVIGSPIANTMIYVLDDRLNPVPTGVPGELYIAGMGVARGYLNRPDLTADRFLPNPFSKKDGDRFYKTGDLGRWRKNGSLEFLGRIDQQVKIRGHRIEPGEIEAAFRRFQGIADVAVVPWADQLGATKLIAYIVGYTGADLPISELKEHLRNILPEYMIPNRYVKIERLPMTPGGKLDRAALPAPGSSTDHATYVEPRSDTEKILCQIYERVLDLERVGIEDNFFEIGGDSIQGLQLVSEAEASGLEFTVQDIFQFQTVAALAARLSRSHAHTAAAAAEMPLQRV